MFQGDQIRGAPEGLSSASRDLRGHCLREVSGGLRGVPGDPSGVLRSSGGLKGYLQFLGCCKGSHERFRPRRVLEGL